MEVTSPFTHLGFYVDKNGIVHQNYWTDPFTFAYVYFGLVAVYIVYTYRKCLITKVRQCLQSIMALSFVVMLVQSIFEQNSYTCITFTYSILAALFLFHYNAYDSETGTLDARSFDSYIREMKGKEFSLISLQFAELS